MEDEREQVLEVLDRLAGYLALDEQLGFLREIRADVQVRIEGVEGDIADQEED